MTTSFALQIVNMKVPVRWILLENYAKQFQPAFSFNPLYQ